MTARPSFVTARLAAERLTPAHFDLLDALHRDERVMATLGGVRSPATTAAYLDDNLRHWEQHGFGLWLFRGRQSGAFVGRGGVRRVEVEGEEETELAYALMPGCWGGGLATEMAAASLEIGFRDLGLGDLIAFTLTTNRASRRVMEKTGFAYERQFVFADLPHVLYRRQAQGPAGG